jgi:hypothetical protein
MAEAFTAGDLTLLVNTNMKGPFFSQRFAEKMKGRQYHLYHFPTRQDSHELCVLIWGYEGCSMTRSLAFEWAKYQIRVNLVSPGPWSTGMLEPVFKDGKTKGARSAYPFPSPWEAGHRRAVVFGL